MSKFPIVMPNQLPSVATRQTHIFDLPAGFCPVSGEPQAGSSLSIEYDACNGHLEVMQLQEYVKSFVGGKKCPHSGEWQVRDMEHLIQVICAQCSEWLNTEVFVVADLNLNYGRLTVSCCTNLPNAGLSSEASINRGDK